MRGIYSAEAVWAKYKALNNEKRCAKTLHYACHARDMAKSYQLVLPPKRCHSGRFYGLCLCTTDTISIHVNDPVSPPDMCGVCEQIPNAVVYTITYASADFIFLEYGDRTRPAGFGYSDTIIGYYVEACLKCRWLFMLDKPVKTTFPVDELNESCIPL